MYSITLTYTERLNLLIALSYALHGERGVEKAHRSEELIEGFLELIQTIKELDHDDVSP